MNRRGADRIGPLGSSGVIAQWGASSLIKSVQSGSLSTGGTSSGNATISAVDPSNALVLHNGHRTSATYGIGADGGVLQITSSTNVSITKLTYSVVDVTPFIVVEFIPGIIKSIQRGYVAFGASTSAVNLTITAVNLSKTGLFFNGRHRYYADSGLPGGGSRSSESYSAFTSSTNLQWVKDYGGDGTGGESSHEGYQIVEFF